MLRRLRQRIELAGMNARRHEEVARAFRRGGGENRRLELEKALRLHAGAQLVDHPPAQHDVGVQLLAAQIEEAVFEPRLFRVGLIAEHGQRQLGRGTQHLDLAHIDFDRAGRHLGVLGAGRALAHLAVEARHPLGAQLFGLGEGGRVGIDDALRDAVMVAQVDEQHAAMVADSMTPAGKADFFADMASRSSPQLCER